MINRLFSKIHKNLSQVSHLFGPTLVCFSVDFNYILLFSARKVHIGPSRLSRFCSGWNILIYFSSQGLNSQYYQDSDCKHYSGRITFRHISRFPYLQFRADAKGLLFGLIFCRKCLYVVVSLRKHLKTSQKVVFTPGEKLIFWVSFEKAYYRWCTQRFGPMFARVL